MNMTYMIIYYLGSLWGKSKKYVEELFWVEISKLISFKKNYEVINSDSKDISMVIKDDKDRMGGNGEKWFIKKESVFFFNFVDMFLQKFTLKYWLVY